MSVACDYCGQAPSYRIPALATVAFTAGRWCALGVGFNIAQRLLDYLIDSAFGHVVWLAWLAG